MTNGIRENFRQVLTAVGLAVWFSFIFSWDARAFTRGDWLDACDMERRTTKAGIEGAAEEKLGCSIAWFLYLKGDAPPPIVGQDLYGGEVPVATFTSGQHLLTFEYIDPMTLAPISGPTIGSVDYQVNIDPDTPDVFIDLGLSFSASTNFSLPYTLVPGTEPLFLAIPFDPFGAPIVIPGLGGFNDALGLVVDIPIPEPSSLLLLACMVSGLIILVKAQ